MNDILELQTGQVSFISGLMAGFSISVAVQILKLRLNNPLSNITFILFTLVSLLFVVALYIDVRLLIETSKLTDYSEPVLNQIKKVRAVGTVCASIALFLFVIAIGLLTWIQSSLTGFIGSALAALIFALLLFAKNTIDSIVPLINNQGIP